MATPSSPEATSATVAGPGTAVTPTTVRTNAHDGVSPAAHVSRRVTEVGIAPPIASNPSTRKREPTSNCVYVPGAAPTPCETHDPNSKLIDVPAHDERVGAHVLLDVVGEVGPERGLVRSTAGW